LRLLWKVEVVGGHSLSELRPPFLMVSNHQSLIDSHVVCLAFGLWPRGLVDPHIVPFHTPEARNFMASRTARTLHTALRCIPIRRGDGLQQPAMDTIIELLTAPRRNVVYMFPEGTRSRDPDGALGRAQPGVGRVVLESGCAVLPVHLHGLDKALPVGTKRPVPGGRIRIAVGDMIPPEQWADLPKDRSGWLAVSEALLDEVKALAPGVTGSE
jgi:1-acyl-sn-glycerol-3-phosphate acyltransferase